MKCSVCGTEIPDDAVFCFECGSLTESDVPPGTDNTDGEDAADEYEELPEEDEDIALCPLCSAEIDRRDKFCRVCGVELNLTKEDEIICPRCGTIIKKKDSFCRECGHSFIPSKQAVIQPAEREEKDTVNGGADGNTSGRSRTMAVFMLTFLVIINILIVCCAIAANR